MSSVSAHSESTIVHSPPGTRPSSRLSVEPPTFEVEPVATPTDGATTPKRVEVPDEFPYPGLEETKKPGLLERALSVLKRSKSQVPQDSIFSSAVGFYAAHATMLAAAIIGGCTLGNSINCCIHVCIWTDKCSHNKHTCSRKTSVHVTRVFML